jgi:hypothetical protein
MCKDSVPASDAPTAGGVPSGLNTSVYLMLGSMLFVLGLILTAIVKAAKSQD